MISSYKRLNKIRSFLACLFVCIPIKETDENELKDLKERSQELNV